MKFGDLLVQLGLVSAVDLHDALIVAPQFGLPIGRTLMLSGRLTENELEVAIELQTLINQQQVSMEQAKKIATDVRGGVPPLVALRNAGAVAESEKTTLGQLLYEAGLVTNEQIDQAQKSSYRMGMQLGRVLVLNGAITHQILAKALNAQQLLRDRKISKAQAVGMLGEKSQTPRTVAAEAQQVRPAPATKSVRFSEFLVLSGLLSEAQMMHALETSMDKKLSLAQTIMDEGTVPPPVFEKATELYNKVCNGEMHLNDATDQVHRVMFGDPIANSRSQSPVLGELLKMTGMVSDDDIHEAISLSNKYPSLIGKMLVLSGAIDEATLIASLRCQFLLKHGYLSVEGAVNALQYSTKHRVSFDDALDELGLRPQNQSLPT
jgi:hypothetical protein